MADISKTSQRLDLISLSFNNEYTIRSPELSRRTREYSYTRQQPGTKIVTLTTQNPYTKEIQTDSQTVSVQEVCTQQNIRNDGRMFISKIYQNSPTNENIIWSANDPLNYMISYNNTSDPTIIQNSLNSIANNIVNNQANFNQISLIATNFVTQGTDTTYQTNIFIESDDPTTTYYIELIRDNEVPSEIIELTTPLDCSESGE